MRPQTRKGIPILLILLVISLAHLTSNNAQAASTATFLPPAQGGMTPRVWLPIVLRDFPPPPTISRYIGLNDMNNQSMWNLGCSRGKATLPGQNILIILDFGYPYSADSLHPDGVKLVGDLTYYSAGEVAGAVEWFISGFVDPNCYAPQSFPAGARLTVAMGVNNNGSGVTITHGRTWAEHVNSVRDWVIYKHWEDRVQVWGGIDAEMAWQSGAITRQWTSGYQQRAGSGNQYIDFGTCESCPFTSPCTSRTQQLSGEPKLWTCADIYDVAWDNPRAQPVPEIYAVNGTHAQQWYLLSVFGHRAYSNGYDPYGIWIMEGAINFKGTVTSQIACQETNPAKCAADGTDNDPATGYLQLYGRVSADPETQASSHMMWWSTDMSWYR